MNGASLFTLMILLMGIMPTLGFFSPGSAFMLLALLLFIVFFNFKENRLPFSDEIITVFSLIILLYSSYYYGGYYQTPFSKALGQIIFFSMIAFISWNTFISKKVRGPAFFIIFYIILGFFTLATSPHPHVDTVVVFKEAPLKLLNGVNPYDTMFSPVYNNIKPDYYNHLPLSFLFYVPFVLFPVDERIAIMIVTLGSFFLLYKRIPENRRKRAALPLSLILFMPGSFYMLEHMYHDSIIFFFLILAVFYITSDRLYYLFLSFFFNIKQNLFLSLPFFISKRLLKGKALAYFIAPFFLILFFFLWNPMAFLNDTLFGLQAGKITSPIHISLTFPTLINYLIPSLFPQNTIRMGSLLLFALFYLLIIKFHKGKPIAKTAAVLFVSYFFSHYAFFNSYYLVALLFLFDFIRDAYFSPQILSKSP